MARDMTYWGPTDEHSSEMVEVDCNREQSEGQGYGLDKEGSGLEDQIPGEEERQGTLVNVCRGVHDPNLDHHVGSLYQ
jgi:hypothetical protein